MKYFIIPITKNPAFGRLGPRKWQDWYESCVKAVDIERDLIHAGHSAEILVIVNVQIKGYRPEAEYYREALKELGALTVREVSDGYETIGQVEIVKDLASKENAKLIVISTFGHYLRVRWLCRGLVAEHYIVFGLPRYRELFTDIALTFLFPIIDLYGRREWFKEKITARRESGRH